MEKRNINHIDINHLQSVNKPTIIKTSKNWVLPPRPRPGRKPNANNTSSASPQPKKTKKKDQQQNQPQQSSQTSNIETALKKIQNENQFLKIELSKLVSDLKTLQQSPLCQQHSTTSSSSTTSTPSILSPSTTTGQHLHKKRNHLEMEELATYKTLHFDELSDDDNVSQISTPSLMSNSSSLVSSGSCALSCIEEEEKEQVLKIEDFLNLSYFENSGNGNQEGNLSTTNVSTGNNGNGFNTGNQGIQVVEFDNKKASGNNQEIEFQFLKDQGVFKGEKDLFLEVGNHGEEIIEW